MMKVYWGVFSKEVKMKVIRNYRGGKYTRKGWNECKFILRNLGNLGKEKPTDDARKNVLGYDIGFLE